MGKQSVNYLKTSNSDFNNVIDSVLNLNDGGTVSGATTLSGATTISGALTGTGLGATYVATSGEQSIPVAAQANNYTIALPANALLLDLGVLTTSAIGGGSASGTVAIKFGTASGGAQLVAEVTVCDANSATAEGSFMSVLNAVEMDASGAAFGDFVDAATMWSAAARDIHVTVTQGTGVAAAIGKAHFIALYTVLTAA